VSPSELLHTATELPGRLVSSDWKTPVSAWSNLRSRTAVAALLVYAATRILEVATAALLLGHDRFRAIHQSLWGWMTRGFDGGWYEAIAAHGYSHALVLKGAYMWFPGYPAVIAGLAWIPGMGIARAGVAVTLMSGLAAAWGIARLGMKLTGDSRVSLLMVALWGTAPGSMVLSMTYSEALFTALAVWALVAVVEQRWLTAGAATIAAGTVHSTAVVLVAAVAVGALIVTWESARRHSWRCVSWRPVAAAFMAPLGLVGYGAFVSMKLGRVDGWVSEEKKNGVSFDWGTSTARLVRATVLDWPRPYTLLAVLVILAALVVAAWSLTEPIPVYLRVYTLGVVLLAVMTNALFLGSKPRFLLPAFLLSLPLARVLAPVPNRVVFPLVAILALSSAWFTLFLACLGWAP
jgi:hypothetical protein